MAKQQSFEDKVKKHKKAADFKTIKVIYAVKSQKTGAWRFPEKFVKVPADANEEKAVVEKTSELVKAFGK